MLGCSLFFTTHHGIHRFSAFKDTSTALPFVKDNCKSRKRRDDHVLNEHPTHHGGHEQARCPSPYLPGIVAVCGYLMETIHPTTLPFFEIPPLLVSPALPPVLPGSTFAIRRSLIPWAATQSLAPDGVGDDFI